MTRNLKILLALTLALGALGPFAGSAQAVPKFTALGAGAGVGTTLTFKPDGAAKVAHHVFVFQKAGGGGAISVTCNELTGDGSVVGPEFAEFTFTPHYGRLNGLGGFDTKCQLGGNEETTFSPGACQYRFTASGLFDIEKDPNVSGECKHGQNPMVFEIPGCRIEIGEQKNKEKLTYNAGPVIAGVATITFTVGVRKLVYNAAGVGCEFGTTENGEYTTGNTLILGSDQLNPAISRGLKWDA